MPTKRENPLTLGQLVEIEADCVSDDVRPWGMVTESATAIWTDSDAEIGVERLRSHPGAYRLVTAGMPHFGLPVLETLNGEARVRSLSERLAAAELRDRGDVVEHRELRRPIAETQPFRPEGMPRGLHPATLPAHAEERFGVSARGRRTFLSDTHSTIINGESRSLVYPSVYPFTAICKLYISHQPSPGAAWVNDSEATGYLIGRSTLMTSGHVKPGDGVAWQIKVVPACWKGVSVFGAGMVTYVRSSWGWHSDSGNDIRICELYDPIGDALGYFGFKGYDSDWEDGAYWSMAGYPYDISLTSMSWETGIHVRDDDDGDDISVDGDDYDTTQVESDADEASGASGAPLWGWWTKGPYAIGVHHGVERDWTISGTETLSCAAGGDGFVAAAHWGRSMWG